MVTYDLQIYKFNAEGKSEKAIIERGFTSLERAFESGAEFYNLAEMNPNTKFAGFNIVYSSGVDELLEIVFKNDWANYYHNNSAAHKLIKKYLPQINLKATRS